MGSGGFDAIVLAGGGARRMGGADKPMLLLAGRPLLSHVLDAVAGAVHRVVVGPRREIGADVMWCQERPRDGGPVAALAAALPYVSAEVVVLVAADLPWIAPAVDPLREALCDEVDAAMLCTEGRVNYLAAALRRAALAEALQRLGDPHGASMRHLVADLATVSVTDPGHWGEGCDSWTDLANARERHAEGSHP